MKILENKRKKSQMQIFEEEENSEIPKTKKQIMYVTQLNRLSSKFLKDDGTFDANALEYVLRESVKPEDGYKWGFIIHDLDMLQDGSLKPPHLHLILYRQKGIQMKHLYDVLDDDVKSNYEYGRSYKAFELYIIHDTEKAKMDGKHLYDEHTVVANYDYVTQIEKYRKQRENAQTKRRKIDYVAKILNGQMKMSDFTCFDTEEEQIMATYYATHKKKIDDAFAIKAKIDRHKELKKLIGEYKENRFKMEKDREEKKVIWIYGESGTGKSLLSRLLAKSFSELADEIYFSSSKNDVFQDYEGQRIVVLEELRPKAIDVDDLFRLFDRNINVSMKRRYHNINLMADVIIINSILSPIQYYARLFGNYNVTNKKSIANAIAEADTNGEPAEQLFRRINQTIEVLQKKDLSVLFSEKLLISKMGKDPYNGNERKEYDYLEKNRYRAVFDSDHKNIKKIEKYFDEEILPF